MQLNAINQGDALALLKTFPSESAHCCVTSPPYWGLRDYGVSGQIGLEPTPQAYVDKMVSVFREVHRVLRDDGTLFLNLGDSYAGSQNISGGLKPKDLVGIPWMVAFAHRADGWYLRQDIIWHKPNPMPESVKDRCTKAHEYLFLLTKSERYFYDVEAIKEPCSQNEMANGFRGGAYCNNETFENSNGGKRKNRGNFKVPSGRDQEQGTHGKFHRDVRQKTDKQRGHSRRHAGFNERWDQMDKIEQCSGYRNKRSVWTIATMPFLEAHFATFPPALIEPCIKAGCPEGGVVLDPFMGAGTTAVVAKHLNCFYVGIELNPAYIDIAERRIKSDPDSLFAPKLQC